ncbi:MAG TPA: stage II sporulation protein M [Fibrobacteria bacterium]|nr:stage II sporulation protein M [Fibrobacteria bacterium]
MRQKLFEDRHQRLWLEAEEFVQGLGIGDPRRLPRLHRALCHSLSVARQRGYSPSLVERLHELSLATHRLLYGAPAERPAVLRQWVSVGFPRLVREEWPFVLASLAAFLGTALVLGTIVWWYPEQAYTWMSPHEIGRMRSMYSPDKIHLGRGGAQSDLMMFGFYIWNNVSICFRTFAGGILGGFPALASLALNGMNLGVVGAVLTADEQTRIPFWSFVATHASFELTGLVLSGASGLKLGMALIAPGRSTRRSSLAAAGRRILPMVAGAALLTLLAAFFEGFWSAQTAVPPWGKFLAAGICWSALLSYLLFAGRSRGR